MLEVEADLRARIRASIKGRRSATVELGKIGDTPEFVIRRVVHAFRAAKFVVYWIRNGSEEHLELETYDYAFRH